MNYTFKWQPNSQLTYFQETDFILLKWNSFEVEKFDQLVEEDLFRLSINPLIGVFNKDLKLFALVDAALNCVGFETPAAINCADGLDGGEGIWCSIFCNANASDAGLFASSQVEFNLANSFSVVSPPARIAWLDFEDSASIFWKASVSSGLDRF